MSQENVETVRRSFDTFSRRDVDAFLALWHPDGEWYPAISSQVGATRHCGHDELREFVEDYYATWAELELMADEIIEVGARVLVLGRVRARGVGSGVELDQACAWIVEFRDDKLMRVRAYLDLTAAHEAVGLSK
jgi:ketosteroid isomerase-like protein